MHCSPAAYFSVSRQSRSMIGRGVRAVTKRLTQAHTQPAYAQLAPSQLGRSAVQIFAANDRMNQILIEHLDPAAWRAKPPSATRTTSTRTIAAIFTHMHNVR